MTTISAVPWSALLDVLFEERGTGRCLVAPDGTILRVNREWLRSTGFGLEDVLGADLVALFPETRDMALAMHARARAGHHVEVPRHAQRVDGRETWWEGAVDPVPMDGGTGLLVTAREMKDGRGRTGCTAPSCGSLFDLVNDAIFVHDASTGAVVDVNRAAEELYEAPREVILAGGVDTFSLGEPPYTAREALAHLRAAAAGQPQRFEWRARTRSGRPFWVEVNLKCVRTGQCERLFAVIRDVTERKRAEAALRESEEHARQRLAELEALYATAPVGLCVFDRNLRWLRLNDRIAEINGVPAAAHLGRTPREVIPDVGEQAEAALRRILETGEPLLDFEMTGTTAAQPGAVRVWSERWVPIKDRTGQVVAISVAAEEITERKRAQQALRESEEKLRLLANAMPQIVCVLGSDGRAEYVNARWTEFSGLDVAGSKAVGWEAVIHPDDLPAAQECRRRALKRLAPQEVELRYRAADGSFRWFLGRLAPVVEGGRVVRLVGAAMEIEDRKRVEQSLKEQLALRDQLAKVAASVPGVICSFRVTPSGAASIPFSAAAIEDLYGIPQRELAGDMARVFARVHPDDAPRVRDELASSASTLSPWRATFRYHHPAKGLRWIQGTSIPAREPDGSTVWHGYVADVTEARRAEEALRASDRRKDEFLGMLSHELRTPLAPIRTSVYLLRHGAGGDPDRPLRVIERQTEHLTRLVDDLLDVTRIARGKIQLRRERVDVREVVRRAGEDFRSVLEERGIAYRVELPPRPVWADADPTRLTQIVGNLLSNAAKFTRRGEAVALSLAVAEGAARIRVADTGAGIDAALLPAVFQPFVQADRTLARADGGLGLGLALVKGLAEAHGGAVAAASAGEGHGAEFTVRIPCAAPAAAAAPDAGRRPGAAAIPRRVLVVDDNRDAADSLAELVRVLGHAAEVAYDGPDALARLAARPADVVLCDIGLPGMDGYEVAREVRARSAAPVLLVAVSGYAQPEDVARTAEAGFDVHVAKPADPSRLAELLG